MAAISNKARALLVTVAGAGSNGTYAEDAKEVAALEKNSYIEVNREAMDESGNIAVRCTDKGYALASEIEATATDSAPEKTMQKESPNMSTTVSGIVSGVALPTATRGRANAYPFEQLEVGQSFFVADHDGEGSAAKRLGGTVSGQNKRFSEETGEVTLNRNGKEVPVRKALRHFIVRKVADGADWGFEGMSGAAVFRVEV